MPNPAARTPLTAFFLSCRRQLPAGWHRRHWLSCAALTGLTVTVLGILPGLAVAKRDAPAYLVQTALELPQPSQRLDLEVGGLDAAEALQLAYDNEEGN